MDDWFVCSSCDVEVRVIEGEWCSSCDAGDLCASCAHESGVREFDVGEWDE